MSGMYDPAHPGRSSGKRSWRRAGRRCAGVRGTIRFCDSHQPTWLRNHDPPTAFSGLDSRSCQPLAAVLSVVGCSAGCWEASER